MVSTVVIVGASLAGSVAAITLRQEGFDGEIVLVGAEGHPPYERPSLSKQYLRGEVPFEKLLVRPPAFYDEHRIEGLYGVRATRVDSRERTVELQNGRRIRYDRLLLATGVRNRRTPIPGRDLAGVLDLRTVNDADAIRRAIAPGRRAVVVGMGFIGCEVAASLRQLGTSVVTVEPSPTPLFHVLGPSIGEIVAEIHRENGVDAIFDDGVAAFEGAGCVQRVVTSRGRQIDCDFVVAGMGVEPDVDVIADSGVAIDNGVLVDEYCRTNIDGIFAAGDVANHYHPFYRRHMRVEHWQNAMQQGAAAARSMIGKPQPYDALHWFWSDQYGINLQYAGVHHSSEPLVVRGSIAERNFLAFYMNEGRVDAIVAFNRGKDLRRALPLIKSRQPVKADRLADDSVDLRDLARTEFTPASE